MVSMLAYLSTEALIEGQDDSVEPSELVCDLFNWPG